MKSHHKYSFNLLFYFRLSTTFQISALRLWDSNPEAHASIFPCLILILLHFKFRLLFFLFFIFFNEEVILFKHVLCDVEIHVVVTRLAPPACFTQITERSRGSDEFCGLLAMKWI